MGIIGDIHEPFSHPRYMEFCQDTFRDWKVDRVHFAGDVVDAHAWSFHDSDPDGLSAGSEYEYAKRKIAKWHKAFPEASVSIGNHDNRHYRAAKKVNIPAAMLKPYRQVWKTPGWKWRDRFTIDGVVYTHGTGNSGKNAALNLAMAQRASVVIGHIHTFPGVQWHASSNDRIFGMNVGCGIDCRSYAMAYSKDFKNRPVLGCGVVIDGRFPFFEPMPCGKREEYRKVA